MSTEYRVLSKRVAKGSDYKQPLAAALQLATLYSILTTQY